MFKVLLLVLVIVVVASILSNGWLIFSPDFYYVAVKYGQMPGVHYLVVDLQESKTLFITSAEYDTPNDVKAGSFSPDSAKFAAVYHYSGPRTWIGVWDIKTGKLYTTRTRNHWTTSFSGVFY